MGDERFEIWLFLSEVLGASWATMFLTENVVFYKAFKRTLHFFLLLLSFFSLK